MAVEVEDNDNFFRVRLICPTYVYLPRKTKDDKKIAVNMNWYRNAYFNESNDAKKAFKEEMRSQLEGLEIPTPVTITTEIHKPTKRKLDKGNVYAVLSKFLFDALTEYGCWPDDCDDFIKHEIIQPTVYDKNNPHAIVEIIYIKEKQ